MTISFGPYFQSIEQSVLASKSPLSTDTSLTFQRRRRILGNDMDNQLPPSAETEEEEGEDTETELA